MRQESGTQSESSPASSPSPFLAFFLLTRPGLKLLDRYYLQICVDNFLCIYSPATSEGRLEAEVDVFL